MAKTIQVGTVLMKEWPGMTQLLNLESEPCSGEWSLLKVLDGFALDRKIHPAGWNFLFMAAEVKVIFFGSLGVGKIRKALKRIIEKVKQQQFNGLEVTEIVARRFLGVPYVTCLRTRGICNKAAISIAPWRDRRPNATRNGPEAECTFSKRRLCEI